MVLKFIRIVKKKWKDQERLFFTSRKLQFNILKENVVTSLLFGCRMFLAGHVVDEKILGLEPQVTLGAPVALPTFPLHLAHLG